MCFTWWFWVEEKVFTKMGKNRKGFAKDLALYIGIVILGLLFLAPFLWGLSTSLKSDTEIFKYPPKWLPSATITQYSYVILKLGGFARKFLNSLIMVGGSMVFTIFAATPAAYVGARFSFRGKEVILFSLLATTMIPGIAILIPLYLLGAKIGLLNSYIFPILVYSAWLTPQVLWYTRGFIENIPKELEESAMIDGCTHIQAIIYIIVPLIRPGLGAMAILVFVFVFSDYLIAAVLNTETLMHTVQVGLVTFFEDPLGVPYGQFMAYAMLASAPIVVSFLILQRFFVKGLVAGSLKG